MPAHLENGETNDGSKILVSVHTIPAQFENGRKFDSKNSLQDFDAKEKYLHPKNRPVSIQKRRKMFCLHHCRVFTRCCFKFRPVRIPFSKSTVFEICRQKMCRFYVNGNGRPIRHIFHRFQHVPASCECNLRKATQRNTNFHVLTFPSLMILLT